MIVNLDLSQIEEAIQDAFQKSPQDFYRIVSFVIKLSKDDGSLNGILQDFYQNILLMESESHKDPDDQADEIYDYLNISKDVMEALEERIGHRCQCAKHDPSDLAWRPAS